MEFIIPTFPHKCGTSGGVPFYETVQTFGVVTMGQHDASLLCMSISSCMAEAILVLILVYMGQKALKVKVISGH